MNALRIQTVAYVFTALLGLVVLVCLGAELFTLSDRVLKNYNEGWNAYHIVHAFNQPGLLYPAARQLFTNNYPPLSFFLVAQIAPFTGDAIIAGRIVSFISVLGIALCLTAAARAAGCRTRDAAVSGLLFLAAPWVIVRFTAMNDPQLLGNFLDAAGLALILRAPRTMASIAASALFLTLAEFVKPLYVTLPLALLVWLTLFERRRAFLLAGFGLLFALIGYGLTAATLHIELLHYIFSPRVYLWSKLTGQPGQWLLVEALPFAATLLLFRRSTDGTAFFAALYAAIGFGLAVFFSGGDGVSASQMMDVSMAVALGAGIYLSRAAQDRSDMRRWSFAGLGLIALLQGVMLVLSFLGLWASRPSLPELMGSRYATRYDVDLIARQPRPVMCETLALCYWAGKPEEVDLFGVTQAFARKAQPESGLTRLFDEKYFGMIQLQPRSQLDPASPLWPALVRNYYLEHQDRNGLFLIPRFPPRL